MKKLLAAVLLIVLTASCSKEETMDVIGPVYPLGFQHNSQEVKVGDVVTLKSNVPAMLIKLWGTYRPFEGEVTNCSSQYTPVNVHIETRHHWLEAQQTDDSTFVFKVHEPETKDTLTNIDVSIKSSALGGSIVTFHLIR